MKSFLLSGAIAIWATGAMAHSPLDGTTPTNEAIVSEMPAEVLMDFKGDIRLVRVAITHASLAAWTWILGNKKLFTRNLDLPMHDMGAGVYVRLNGVDLVLMVMP